MIAKFKSENSTSFNFNGLDKQRNYLAHVIGNNIMVFSAYNSKDVLLRPTPYNDIEINGDVKNNVEEAHNALTPLLFTKNIVTSGGALISTSNTLKFHNSTDGVVHQGISGNLVIDPLGNVNGGYVLVNWSGNANPNITGVSPSLIRRLSGSDDITTQGSYLIGIAYQDGRYWVSIKSHAQYVGAGGGGTGEQAPILTTTLSGGGQTETAPILTTTLS